jgi:hypothetical protein
LFFLAKRRHGCRRTEPIQFSLLWDFYSDYDFKVARVAQEISYNVPAVYDVWGGQ